MLTSTVPLSAPAKIESDTFYNLSFPEAARKFLGMSNKRPKSTNAIIDVLVQGGLKKAAYNTMYATLARRSRDLGTSLMLTGIGDCRNGMELNQNQRNKFRERKPRNQTPTKAWIVRHYRSKMQRPILFNGLSLFSSEHERCSSLFPASLQD
jgi:hypothetical protein